MVHDMKDAGVRSLDLTHTVETIRVQWQRFVQGEPVDLESVRPEVLSSWRRSRIAGIDPYNTFVTIIISEEDAEKQKLSHDELLKAFGSVIPIIEEIIVKNHLNLQLFDGTAQSVHLALYEETGTGKSFEELESKMLGNLSERVDRKSVV